MPMYSEKLRFKTYWKDSITCSVKVEENTIFFENYVKEWWKLPLGVSISATIDDVEEFFEDRCFPRERVNCKDILRRLGLDCYELELICRKTHGMQFDDFLWIKFEEDDKSLCWNDIKLRD